MQADIFFLIETHLIEEKTEKIRKYFRDFTLYSVPYIPKKNEHSEEII